MTDLLQDAVDEGLTEAQLEDLALLLERYVNIDNIDAIASRALGRSALKELGNDVGDVKVVARKVVDLLQAEGRISEAVALLLRGADPNSHLALGLNYILTGGRLNDDAAMQKFVNQYEPFLSAGGFQETFTRLTRTVCAIGLVGTGPGFNTIVGTGFLVGPDLVMTNYHVLEPLLKVTNGKVEANGPGERILCFFDFLWEPSPRIPANPNVKHTALEVHAVSQDWVVHGRPKLPFDGTAQCPPDAGGNHDFVVFRIAQPVGLLAARASEGEPRGWLSLPDQVDLFQNRRVIVHQHPGAKPQQFDIGDYIRQDPTGTRVWYTVSTARGSSGGAAVDAEGKLFALHNAEVQADLTRKMNQGVLINLIAQDLAAHVPDWPPAAAPDAPPLSFWSLVDKKDDPQPIIGRKAFREEVDRMNAGGDTRILIVSGPQGSGRHFSYDLLMRTKGAQQLAVKFSPDQLAKLEPKEFATTLVKRLGISASGAPDPNPAEDIPQWLLKDLAPWLAAKLAADEQRDKSRYPAWVVIDTIVPNDTLLWADDLPEALMVFAGVRAAVDIPQLRWLFLTEPSLPLPFGDVKRYHDDLSIAADYRAEFVECLRLAWRSVNKEDRLQNLQAWRKLAGGTIAKAPNEPPRKVLGELIRTIILTPDEEDE